VHAARPDVPRHELIAAGLNICRDVVGTMVLTLVFAFVGLKLPVLLLPEATQMSAAELVNSEAGASEILLVLAGAVALVITGLMFAALVTAFLATDWKSFDLLPGLGRVPAGNSTLMAGIGMGATLFDRVHGFILPFEISAILLLAAIIGAIVLVREK
jgi:NADH:ubiquinone oxidoreductase subunit 6 (subunit J)